MSSVVENLIKVREMIGQACQSAGVKEESVQLIAVSKTVSPDRINEAVRAGACTLGENRVQELMDKIDSVDKCAKWHLIGQLQTNKVKYIVDRVELIHSVDRLELAAEIQKQCEKRDTTMEVLAEVNVSGEISKAGMPPKEVERFMDEVAAFDRVKVKGFMTIAPIGTDHESARPYFRQLRQIFERYETKGVKYLSMGMSSDFRGAIMEGSNMVRIGSAIFGVR